ncbi:MAG: FkbM family methyltransferase [Rhodobacteraceae bacterium]|nr:MAG: FkbM family methyltransferase [Paracoccaceae bacterium]
MEGPSDNLSDEPVADAAMDAKMRQIYARFDKPWVRQTIRQMLPPTRVTCLGCEFIVHARDNFTEFRMWETGTPPEAEATLALAGELAGSDAVIVDVGANAGAFSLPILKAAGQGARVIAFEPNPVMRARLAVNVALNGLGPAMRVFDCAVGAEAGRSVLHFPRNGNLGQGRIDVAYDKGGTEGVEVAIRPLAECLAEAGVAHVDFLKVDVEGLEDRVIVPFLEEASAPKPRLIYFEISHDGVWKLPLLEVLQAHGYARARDFDNNALFRRKA